MSQADLFEYAMKRPQNYHKLSARDQWSVDKRLGILDWDGSCSHKNGQPCEECLKKYWKNHSKG